MNRRIIKLKEQKAVLYIQF